jgi:TolB protein
MSCARTVGLAIGLGICASAASAQRQPVLPQIKVPHPYYYREMYLPQATSGPSGVTWSPDGRELIYSMQGSLWRQRLGSTEARQLTASPGYDYQPDWSPDGRQVLYAFYDGKTIDLRSLDLASGESRTLVSNGAVNVEPRWSPDGGHVAFVSSVYQGRWHIFVAAVDSSGALGAPERITLDTLSGLPRYYYEVHDQYLSPTWAPDGKDLIFISNRGHIWGSGGFWRMAATPGREPRELHYEETTWRARPDWSRDGKRVVYSSYLGGQWHQLWLMTADGGDAFQLTYGQGDATAPRWAPDGNQIAYISNANGNTALQVVQIPGGRITSVPVKHRIYREPVGTLRLTVVDASGRALPARVSITGADGRSFAPDDAWRRADDSFDPHERALEYGYFHSTGDSRVTVPAGPVMVEVSRGPEYRVYRSRITISRDSTFKRRVVLQRMLNLTSTGWYSGDVHVHMNYGGAYRNTPRRLADQARAEDLHLVENLIVNKEGRFPDEGYFSGKPDPASTSETVIVHDQEYHTSYWGHAGLLGLRDHLILPGYAGYANTAAASLYPSNSAVMDLVHQQGGITGYVHPFDSYPNPWDTVKALTNEFPVDVALGKVDYYEALGFVDDYLPTARVWYQILNCGFRLSAAAGTDAMANFASLRGPVGLNRVFVKSGSPLEHHRWLDSLKAGRSFATNGPLLGFTLNDRELGQELRLPDGGGDVTAKITLNSIVPIDTLEVVRNGAVAVTVPLTAQRTNVSLSVKLAVHESGWYILRARGAHPAYPILDAYPYATTSPIYVIVGGRPIRSPTDARYFIAWIDRLEAGAEAYQAWNTPAEKSLVLDEIRRARKEFEGRLER